MIAAGREFAGITLNWNLNVLKTSGNRLLTAQAGAWGRRLDIAWQASFRLWLVLIADGTLSVTLLSTSSSSDSDSGFVGTEQCAACHLEIASRQMASDHAQTMMRVQDIPELMQALPVEHVDHASGVRYRVEHSAGPRSGVELVARKGAEEERLRLLWGVGAGRKGITFIGQSGQGAFGQSRVSWYQKIGKLDVTTGLEKTTGGCLRGPGGLVEPPRERPLLELPHDP